jgi:hypothetical protein
MKNCIKDELRKKIRETSLSGGEVLRSLDKAVEKLDQFVAILEPLQKTVNQIGEKSQKIDKHLNQVKDEAAIVRQAYSLVNELQSPLDSRSHLKNLEQASSLLMYFKNHPDVGESERLLADLPVAIASGYSGCVKLMEEQVAKYNEIYSVSRVIQTSSAQVELLNTIKELIETCKSKSSGYWPAYVKLRSSLLCKYLNITSTVSSPYVQSSHPVIQVLTRFVHSAEVESELLTLLLSSSTVQDQVSEVLELPFQTLNSLVDQTLGKKPLIQHLLDCLSHFNAALPKIEATLGKTVKYYAISKTFTTVLQKCQGWYRDYVQNIQSAKVDFGDNVHEMSLLLAKDLKEVYAYPESVAIAKLEQSVVNLITSLSDSYKIKIKSSANKQQGLTSIFLINNMSFLISLMNDLGFSGNEDAMTRIEKEMLAEIEEYSKNTWVRLAPVLSENPNVIEFKKGNVLTNKSRNEVKKKFNNFNLIFPEIFNYHKNFSIYNRDILQLLRKKHMMTIIPAYKEFLNRYLSVDFTTRREKYTLFPLENVERGLANMYSFKPL